VPLDHRTVEKLAGRQIRDLQQTRYVSDHEKRRIRKTHERIARKVDHKRSQ